MSTILKVPRTLHGKGQASNGLTKPKQACLYISDGWLVSSTISVSGKGTLWVDAGFGCVSTLFWPSLMEVSINVAELDSLSSGKAAIVLLGQWLSERWLGLY